MEDVVLAKISTALASGHHLLVQEAHARGERTVRKALDLVPVLVEELLEELGRVSALRPLLALAARPFAHLLALFDDDVGEAGLTAAARRTLARMDIRLQIRSEAPLPAEGPLLVVSNHPGNWDILGLVAAMERGDVAVLALDRPALGPMENLRRHLLLIPRSGGAEARSRRELGARAAVHHLATGGALVHFPAGALEPDPLFSRSPDAVFKPWRIGTGSLIRSGAEVGAQVAVAMVGGVHSPRAFRIPGVRQAEARGISALTPLLTLCLRTFRDVQLRVECAAPRAASALGAESATNEELVASLKSQAANLVGRLRQPP